MCLSPKPGDWAAEDESALALPTPAPISFHGASVIPKPSSIETRRSEHQRRTVSSGQNEPWRACGAGPRVPKRPVRS
ncbi:hypothetical protein PsorP6_009970 [Peronosclerospora sorghi]|uniref:Uncharacterized protein n=1 Tax=Peronosclerospora sorghi TaxID=230839 RepID=A0ACC0VW25_9STRA|nr:hypothetical protein PsorP6_009970 [Peronosclerospora sorghi]